MKTIKLFIILYALCNLSIPTTIYSQWYQQSIPVSNPIVGLEFVDSLRGWAATSSYQDTSYVLYTTNGGNNWNVQLKITGIEFEVLDAVDSSVIYLGGYKYSVPTWTTLLLKSTNAGTNWVDMNMTVSIGFDDMFFVNRDSGYMCENTIVELYRTTNGGVNWERKINGINQFPYKLFFINYLTGYCGASQNLLKTTNAGENWFALSSFTGTIYSVFFANEIIGWLGLSGGRILNTTNSGSTWNYQGIFNFFNNIEDIKFANSLAVGWAGTGARFKIFKTTNSGNTWGYQIDSSTSKNISIVDSLKGWTGDFGIANTTNGGGIITHINSYTNFIPEDYILYQNYPNPFNSQTKISFEVKSNSFVKLIIYDITGREINIWQSNGILLSGRHEFLFDAKGLSSGVYFYKLEARTQDGVVVFSKSKKMILSK
ncbi:MAG: T9SS type A sorting domain-containing protein [Ignavibacteria bacterium]|nr:T9SS type A sorting domain-containing protein [Ignavibacteria bacterium]